MPAPTVQSLEQVMAELNPVFQQQTDLTNQQIGGLGAKYDAQRSAVEGAKTMGFRDIARSANNRGLDFWGTPIEEQNTYLATKYLPGMQQANTQQNEESLALQKVLADINSQKRTQAMGTVERQQSALQTYLEAERQREFEMQKLREQARLSAASEQSGPNPGQQFLDYISNQFKMSGGQGNKAITRQQQDAWANAWFALNGVNGATNRQGYWDLFNSTYNRSNDATKDWRYKR